MKYLLSESGNIRAARRPATAWQRFMAWVQWDVKKSYSLRLLDWLRKKGGQ